MRVATVFFIGFTLRYFIQNAFNINVFSDIFNAWSICYYITLASINTLLRDLLPMPLGIDNVSSDILFSQPAGNQGGGNRGGNNQGGGNRGGGNQGGGNRGGNNQGGGIYDPLHNTYQYNGFTYNATGPNPSYSILDPTGVVQRVAQGGFANQQSYQPYARNLAAALQHLKNNRPDMSLVGISQGDTNFFTEFCSTRGQGQVRFNSNPARKGLRDLP